MNLLDILNQILDTKTELKSLLDENNNIARYPVTIHNVMAAKYNEGYAQGYCDRWNEEFDADKWPDAPRSFQSYDSNDDTNYNPYSVDGLVDIMSDVLNYRVNMRDELETASNSFVTYPDILRSLLNTIYDAAYEDGQSDAEDDIQPAVEVQTPTFTFSNNQFTITSSQPGARCFYSLGSGDGVSTLYQSPVTITETVTVYYYAKIGSSKSATSSFICVYDAGGYKPDNDDVVVSPRITVTYDNTVIITKGNSDDIVYYQINDGAWNIYTSPFKITADCTISAYSTRGGVTSICNVVNVTYNENPDQPPVTPTCAYPTFDQDVNYITLSCSTSGATIWYRIGSSGSYTQYTGGFTITEQQSGSDMYCYASKDGYNDSSIVVYTLYVLTFCSSWLCFYDMVDPDNSSNLHIWTPTVGATLYWRIGAVGPWTHVDYNHANIYPQNDCIVYAYAENQYGTQSDITSFEYTWYSQTVSLPLPTLSMRNNRVYVSVDPDTDYTDIYFTLDGNDPKGGNVYSTSYNRSNIVITENGTTVKVRAMYVDENYSQKWSEVVTGVFSPVYDEESFDYSFEYFTVQGARTILLTGTTNASNYIMSWSYDKTNWNSIQESVTGLDPSKKVYLKILGSNSYRQWDTMRFGSGDHVTISGSIVSLIWADSYTEHTTVTYEQTFRRCFADCVELVDASNLIIPITNSLGSDYAEMFSGCINLVSGPSTPIPCHNLGKNACYRMFYGCTSLKSGLKGTFNTLGDYACKEMYKGCINLNSVGNYYLDSIGKSGMESCFEGCSSLSWCSLEMNGDMTECCFKNCFNGCSGLNSDTSFGGMINLSGISIKAQNTAKEACYRMFYGCTGLAAFGDLPGTVLTDYCYYEMFKGCTSLGSFGTLGATSGLNNARYSMYGMFEGCTSLTTAPTLSIHNLDSLQAVYWRLFYGCSSLNYIKALFLTDPAQTNGLEDQTRWYWPYTKDWVYGVAEKGVFEQDDDAAWFRTGVNAIPLTWTMTENSNRVGEIVAITCEWDRVTITASNDNAIYYKLNDNSDDDGTMSNWTLYTGPFTLSANAIVYARCLSNRGIWGNVVSQLCEITVPKLQFTQDGNTISINPPAGYTYDTIYYRLTPWNTSNYGEWTAYTGPFTINESYYIDARGLKLNGEYGPVSGYIAEFNLGLVGISCSENVVTLYSEEVSNYTGGNNVRIEYKINNGEWTVYDQLLKFVITETCSVTARVAGYNGTWIYGPESTATCVYDENGAGYVLPVPVFKQKFDNNGSAPSTGNPNIIICTYSIPVAQMSERGIKIMYRMNGGAWAQWILKGSSAETQTIISENTVIDTYAIVEEDNISSVTVSYSFSYDSSYASISVPAPSITIVRQNGYDYAYITCSDSRANCFVHADNTVNLSGWRYIKNGDSVSLYHYANPSTFTIQAYAVIDSYQSNVTSREYTYIPDGQYTGDEMVPPVIRCSSNIVTISSVQSFDIYYSKNGRDFFLYAGPFEISTSGNIYAYTKDNTTNETSDTTITYCQFEDLNPLFEPTIQCIDNYIVINTVTSGATIYYRLDGGSWATYSGPISINTDTICEAYTMLGTNTSNTVTVQCVYVDPGSVTDYLTITCTRTGYIRIDMYDTNTSQIGGTFTYYYKKNGGSELGRVVGGSMDREIYLESGDRLQLRGFSTTIGNSLGTTHLGIGRYNMHWNPYDVISPENTAEYILSGSVEALIGTRGQSSGDYFIIDNVFFNGVNTVSYTNLDLGSYTAAQLGLTNQYNPVVIPAAPTVSYNDNTYLVTLSQSAGYDIYYSLNDAYGDDDYTSATWTQYSVPFTISESVNISVYSIYQYTSSEVIYSVKVRQYLEVSTPSEEYISNTATLSFNIQDEAAGQILTDKVLYYTVTRPDSNKLLFVSVTAATYSPDNQSRDTDGQNDISGSINVAYSRQVPSSVSWSRSVNISYMIRDIVSGKRSGVTGYRIDADGTSTLLYNNDTDRNLDPTPSAGLEIPTVSYTQTDTDKIKLSITRGSTYITRYYVLHNSRYYGIAVTENSGNTNPTVSLTYSASSRWYQWYSESEFTDNGWSNYSTYDDKRFTVSNGDKILAYNYDMLNDVSSYTVETTVSLE